MNIAIDSWNKSLYRKLCDSEPTIPVFSRDWWLDACVGESGWDVAIVGSENTMVAAMPYTISQKMGLQILGQPKFSQTLGPWLTSLEGKYPKILSTQKEVMFTLIEQLPDFDYFLQNWHYSISNWLPFFWKGFNQTTRYTYLINLDNNYDAMAHFTSNMRNKVRKSQEIVEILEDLDVESFYEINKMTFKRQNLHIPYSLEELKKLDYVLDKQGKRKIFYAVDELQNIHSALYLVWDDISSYVHLVGENPKFRNSGAGILLIYKAIQRSMNMGLSLFDFEGSMIENVEVVRRSCGGIQTPYFNITKMSKRAKMLATGRDFFKASWELFK